jgi:hypothetical protein
MQLLNTYKFYELGAKLHGLFAANASGRIADMFVPLTEAQALLDGFIKGDTVTLDTSKADATRLLNKIGSIFNRYFIDPATKQLKASTGEDRIDPHEMSLVHTLIEKFEHALAAELSRTPAYVAGKRGIYSTFDLAERAENVFGDTLRTIVPTLSQDEFNAAGRALAFGLGTAATVHLLRATEVMLKVYYEAFTGSPTAKNERNYAIYLKKLTAMSDEEERQVRPDKRVVQMLSQIKDHYRNPLVSPDSNVSVDEAMQLFGMASALISLMAEQIEGLQDRPKAESKGTKGDGNKSLTAAASALSLGDDDEIYDYPLSQAG